MHTKSHWSRYTPGDPGHPDVAIPLPDGWAEVAHDVFPQAHTVIVAPEYIIDDWSPQRGAAARSDVTVEAHR